MHICRNIRQTDRQTGIETVTPRERERERSKRKSENPPREIPQSAQLMLHSRMNCNMCTIQAELPKGHAWLDSTPSNGAGNVNVQHVPLWFTALVHRNEEHSRPNYTFFLLCLHRTEDHSYTHASCSVYTELELSSTRIHISCSV